MELRTDPVRVAVPATSANLGPGFDSLGLALSLEDEVTAQVSGSGVRVGVVGEGAGEVPGDERHLIVSTMRATFDVLGVAQPAGLALHCVNRIPHARGLGSSSAAIVAGILLARALVQPVPAAFDQAAMLRLAARIEGHPDNVAPCLLGGFTIAWTDDPGGEPVSGSSGATGSPMARAVRLPVAPAVATTVFVPSTRGLTATARAVLPARVAHADAVFNLARTALLVHALTSDPSLLFEATADRLHQPYRAPGMPATAELLHRLRQAGVPAAISGAGPSVLAFSGDCPDPGEGWDGRSVSVSSTGARILLARHAEGDPVAAGLQS
ncbi:MAG TPA: homoserine kinase [Micromonosporaceae bacterium]